MDTFYELFNAKMAPIIQSEMVVRYICFFSMHISLLILYNYLFTVLLCVIKILTNLISLVQGSSVESEVADDTELNGFCHLFCCRSKLKMCCCFLHQEFPEHVIGSQYIF